ncbi:MAG: LytTR family DNA-binding domain-containing protein [Bacteroidota bacterium]
MKVIIIEDEPIAAQHLQKLLTGEDPEIQVLEILPSVKKAVAWFLANPAPDLIFMDIQLNDDLSFRIFDLVEVKTPVIFTTAYDHYAIKAFKLNSVDYLLKPLDSKELRQALQKFNTLYKQPDWIKLLASLGQQPEYQKRFMVTSGNKIRSIASEEIAYFRADGRYVHMHTRDTLTHIIDHSLDKLEDILDPALFFRINRQFIVHIHCIRQMSAYTKGRIKIETEPPCKEDVIVSIDRSGNFKKWLNH